VKAIGAVSSWDGSESPWVLAATAAAPWPLFSLVLGLGLPGGPWAPDWLRGPLALSLVFGLMVAWVRRLALPLALNRWLPSVLGAGATLELVAGALARFSPGSLEAPARGLATIVVCVAIYELGPAFAAACSVSPCEPRSRSLDIPAYVAFGLCALAAALWEPTARGGYLTPWIAALVALPLATARSGPSPALDRIPALPRVGVSAGLATVAWLVFGAIFFGIFTDLAESARRTWRWGTDPLEGALWALPTLSLLFSMLAALGLLRRARLVAHAPSGRVAGLREGGLVLERADDEPACVELEAGKPPPEGATVTLLGARPANADIGPFRDGAALLRARLAWCGSPEQLASALKHRAAGWIAWAAACALGLWLRMT